MGTFFNLLAHIHAGMLGIAALVCLALALCWALNRKWREQRLAELRAKLAEMQPSDPGYGQVRALYTDMVIRPHGSKGLQGHAEDGHATPDGSASDGSSGSSGSD